MIYFKRLNTCFIRIPKNASSSAMLFLYDNVWHKEDTISRMYRWNEHEYDKTYHENCPVLPNAHVDAKYVIDNGIVPATAQFYGIIREPLERCLSLYLYRIRDGRYGKILPSPEHFQSLFKYGVLQDTPQQMQIQSTFLNETGKYWLYEDIEKQLTDFCAQHNIKISVPLQLLNKSPGDTKRLVPIFFSNKVLTEFKIAYQKDFELYEKVKNNDVH
jgi:hypothetical protein